MTSRHLARRLERLENRILAATEEPPIFVIAAVSYRREIVDRFRLTSSGLLRLTPDDDPRRPDATSNGR
jgi:hypothetical protein